jgi:hypothetical protein
MVRTWPQLMRIVPFIGGILSLFHSQLIDLSLSIVMPGFDWVSVSIAVHWRRWIRCWRWRRTWMWIGACSSNVTSLFTIVAFPLSWSMFCILSGMKPLDVLNSSIGSLKVVGQLDHLVLRGRKSLSHWLRHLLKTLLYRVENRSSRWRVKMG